MKTNELNPTLLLLLEATEELILEKGCQHTTLQDILHKSGVSKGAVYHYVNSKDELFALILKEKQLTVDEQFSEEVSASEDGDAPFQGIAQRLNKIAHTDVVSNLIFIYLLSKMENTIISETLQVLHDSAVHMGAEWIKVGKEHKVIPEEVDEERLSEMFNVFKYGLVVQNLVSKHSKLEEKDIYQLLIQNLKK